MGNAKSRAWVALILLALMFAIGAAAVSEAMHEHVHTDADHADHSCLIAQLAQGQLTASASDSIEASPKPLLLGILPAMDAPAVIGSDFRLLPGRAPPLL
jgi:hypothetical protein